MTDELPIKNIYGIWQPGAGWWKVPNPDGVMEAYADTRFFVALRYALWVGKMARVEIVDPALVAGERYLLECEKRPYEWMGKLWHTLRSLIIIRAKK